MSIFLLLCTAALYYITKIDQLLISDLSFWLIEQQTKIGVPLWYIPMALSVLLFFANMSNTPKTTTAPSQKSRPAMIRSAKNSIERVQLSAEWKNEIIDQCHSLKLPTGAHIEIDPFKGVPIGLKLERTTPQATRRALEEFALLLSQIPTPPRVFVKLLDIMKIEVPTKNLVKGSLQKHLNCNELSLTSQMDGVDIRFHKPNQIWDADANLGFDI